MTRRTILQGLVLVVLGLFIGHTWGKYKADRWWEARPKVKCETITVTTITGGSCTSTTAGWATSIQMSAPGNWSYGTGTARPLSVGDCVKLKKKRGGVYEVLDCEIPIVELRGE